MFGHYLKIAFRNIRKYALQNVASIIGLATGFICICFSFLWIHYEESFDTFHDDADRLFTLSRIASDNSELQEVRFDAMVTETLLSFPDVESYAKWNYRKYDNVTELTADTMFFRFFEFKVLNGVPTFLNDTNYVAISKEYAEKCFHGDNPIGQSLVGKTICAIVAPFDRPSIFKFDLLSRHDYPALSMDVFQSMRYSDLDNNPNVLFKLHRDTDMELFSDSLSNTLNSRSRFNYDNRYVCLSIKDIHKQTAEKSMYIGYEHSRLFVWSSILLTLCALVNFMLFNLNRIIIRENEMVLRMVHGASRRSLLVMMTIETGIILGMATVLGWVAVVLLKDRFIAMADISMTGGYVMAGSLIVMASAFLAAMIICIASAYLVRRKSMSHTMSRRNGSAFRKASIGIQLFVSVLFLFIVSGMLNQYRYLRNNDWGVRINDVGVLKITNPANGECKGYSGRHTFVPEEYNEQQLRSNDQNQGYWEYSSDFIDRLEGQYGITQQLRSIPCVSEIYTGIGDIRDIYKSAEHIYPFSEVYINGKASHKLDVFDVLDSKYMDMLSLNVTDGDIPVRPIRNDEVVITRSLQRELGLGNVADAPVIDIRRIYRTPQTLVRDGGEWRIIGGDVQEVSYCFNVIAVISDIYPLDFNLDPVNALLCSPENRRLMGQSLGGWSEALYSITFYSGTKNDLRRKIDEIMAPTGLEYELKFTEDEFYESLSGERHLTTLIEILGLLCLLISLSGFYSMIALSCQERRREIAVRKVHGARCRDILALFARDYGVLFIVSSAFGLLTGSCIVKDWMKQFQQQAALSWWIYAGIIVAMSFVISFTVYHRILKTARENPYEVIKNE